MASCLGGSLRGLSLVASSTTSAATAATPLPPLLLPPTPTIIPNPSLDKPALFRNFFKWLKTGGKVLISDYCRSPGKPSEEFAAYIKQRGYDLHDVQAYGQMLENAGFNDVIAEDRTDQFLRVLQRELVEVGKNKDGFLSDFTQEDYDYIVNGWNAKLKRTTVGEQRWGLFIATK